MTSVFLSYDREDSERARSLAKALEKAGHSVWWDHQIAGGAQYGNEIEEALTRSDAVVVLWSACAIKSAWVKDEAAAGRDAGKLVPVSLDKAEPPLGFRQYQTIDLSTWRGRPGSAPFKALLHGIDTLTGQERPKLPVASAAPAEGFRLHGRWLAILVIIAGLAIGGWFAWSRLTVSRAPIVSIAATDSGASSQGLARDLFVKLGRLKAVDTNPIRLVDQGARQQPDFRFKIGGSNLGQQMRATITLTGRDNVLLWSQDFEVPADRVGDLTQQIGISAARVLECASEGMASGRLDQPILKLYLNGCAALSELAGTDFRALVPVFRKVTDSAPAFQGGWAHLLLAQSYVIGWETLSGTSPEARELQESITEARRRFPLIPEAYWADYALNYGNILKQAEIVDQATEANPDHPVILSMRSGFLVAVGRMQEAVETAKRTSELVPLSPDETGAYINVLGWAGQPGLAKAELDKAERLWPGARTLIDVRWRYHLRYGDPREALRITRSGVNAGYAEQEPFLLARIDRTPQSIDRAVANAKSLVGRVPRAEGLVVQILAEFGREDQAYAFIAALRRNELAESFDAFFRPPFRKFLRNPRFMRLARDYGRVAYWQKSGKWPDFCYEPDMPYDCKAEAAKLAA